MAQGPQWLRILDVSIGGGRGALSPSDERENQVDVARPREVARPGRECFGMTAVAMAPNGAIYSLVRCCTQYSAVRRRTGRLGAIMVHP